MAKVPLRSYNHDIERLIDQGQCEEAIAHCRHILESFPKHLETYRLLGKAYLESQRYGEAADIFLRVLSSIPDDFVSNIGMSIIREDEGNLEAAIWHMERAYEAQPANSAIQDELRRIIGRRDKVEPSRVRLTRGALVRMYVRGDLYYQAIAEARVAISEEPQRADIQILLAKMCYLAGQRVEATDICNNLLTKYPYCFEANQILADILPEIKRTEDAQMYRMRINALEPYAAFVSQDLPTPLDVPETAVMLDELFWHPAPPAAEQPQWASTLGINVFNQSGTSEKIPEWFNEPAAPAASPQTTTPALIEAPEGTELSDPEIQDTINQLEQSELPDWMKSAGFVASTGNKEEPPPEMQETVLDNLTDPEADIPKANLPDWLKKLAPQLPAEEEGAEEIKSFENLFAPSPIIPDFTQTESIEPPVNEESPLPQSTKETFSVEANAEQSSEIQPSQPGFEDQESAMAWLEGLAAKQGADEESLFVKPEDRTETPPAWIIESSLATPSEGLTENSPEETQGAQTNPEITGIEPAAIDFAAKQVVEEDSPSVKPEETQFEIPPVWVQEFGNKTFGTEAENPPATEPAQQQTQNIPPEIIQQPITAAPSEQEMDLSVSDQDSAFAWLESLAAKHGAEEDTLLVNPEDRSEVLPDWIQKASTTPSSPPAEETPDLNINQVAELGSSQVAEAAPEQPVSTTIPTEENQADAFAWLESLAAKQGADEESLLVKPEDRKETPPEWIVESTTEAATNTVSAPEKETPSIPMAEQVPAWLQDLEKTQDEQVGTMTGATPPPEETPVVPISEEVPEWIQGLEKTPVEQQPLQSTPVSLSEETPAEKIKKESDWLHTLKATEIEQPLPQNIPEPESTDLSWLQSLEQTAQEAIPEETQRIVLPRGQETSNETEMIPLAAPYVSPAPPIPSTGSEQSKKTLKEAQYNLASGKIDLAIKGYYLLVESNQLLDETIHDLRDALYKYPIEIALWQALGDAYVRSNRLQDALDAYTQAEDLIR